MSRPATTWTWTSGSSGPGVGLLFWVAIGLGLAPFTFGVSILLVAYPVWFLVAAAPRVETCGSCGAEYVDFRRGPRV